MDPEPCGGERCCRAAVRKEIQPRVLPGAEAPARTIFSGFAFVFMQFEAPALRVSRKALPEHAGRRILNRTGNHLRLSHRGRRFVMSRATFLVGGAVGTTLVG